MYDLRFPSHLSTTTTTTKINTPHTATRPLLCYPDHQNEYRVNLGFDVETELGLLAVGMSIFSSPLLLISSFLSWASLPCIPFPAMTSFFHSVLSLPASPSLPY